jgi:hypothetical protein
MSLKDNLLTLLRADTTLMTALPGGLHGDEQNTNALAMGTINRQETPTAFDTNGELKCCALVVMETEAPLGTIDAPDFSPSRAFFRITFYLDSGAARDRAYALLNYGKLTGNKVWQIHHADDVLDQYDDVLKAAMDVSRYEVVRLR